MRRPGASALVALLLATAGLASVVASGGPAGAAFTGSNGQIAFVKGSTGGGQLHVWVTNPDGSGQQDLQAGATALQALPVWSPDSTKIAFMELTPSGDTVSSAGIFVMSKGGSGATKKIDDGWDPSWSPASVTPGELAYYVRGDTKSDVLVVDPEHPDTSKNLTNAANGEHNVDPAWSPTDGKVLAFYSDRASGPGIYTIDPTSSSPSAPTKLFDLTVNIDDPDSVEPEWSPDGKKIAYDNGTGGISVFDTTAAASATNPKVLITEAAHAAWSPDGTKIAVLRGGENGINIFVTGQDGSNPVNVTKFPDGTFAFDPSWGSAPLAVAQSTTTTTATTTARAGGGTGSTTAAVPEAKPADPIRTTPRFTG